MGQQIYQSEFSLSDYHVFKENLRRETAILSKWFQESAFDNEKRVTGLEVEYWLVDRDFLPVARNKEYVESLEHPQIVLETSKYNAELNSSPVALTPKCLSESHSELEKLWKLASEGAEKLGMHAITIGSLPTVRDTDLGLENLSDGDRYRALNRQVMLLRKGRPIRLDVDGRDHLQATHQDIMLEATATSLQCHFQVEYEKIVDYYNASLVGSPFLIALAANSPYLFGQDLWDETRIPIFEQGIRLPCFSDPDGTPIARVGFGSGYVRESLFECFLENLDGYPVLIPVLFQEDPEWLTHLRFHNGNIWRWNRPIVGLNRGGKPHLRIEQRVPSSGPTISDMIANQAFYLGMTHALATQIKNISEKIPFDNLRKSFYAAAKDGLRAQVNWIDGKSYPLQNLLLDKVLPLAIDGLKDLGIQESDIDKYAKQVLLPRARSGRTGAEWQRAYVATHGKDFQGLVKTYWEHQKTGRPVHLWDDGHTS